MTAELLEVAPQSTAPVRPARLRPPVTRQRFIMRAVVVIFLAATVWAWLYAEMSFGGLVTGFGDLWNLLERMTPPKFAGFGTTFRLVLESLWMAVIGTTIAVALSVPLAFGAARNTTPHRAVMASCRGIIVLARAIPDLVFAAVFVRALSIGVLPGVLALGVHSIGMIGKLFADAIEQTSPQPREAVSSVGARKWQTIATSVIPQAMPGFIGTSLYRLDINLRSSTVLGIVGAGGIGHRLDQFTGSLQWDKALGVVIVIFVFITVMEFVSSLVRSSLLGGERTMVGRSAPRLSLGNRIARQFRRGAPSAGTREFDRSNVRPPFTGELKAKLLYGVFFGALVIAAFTSVRLNPFVILTSLDDIWDKTTAMFPLDFTTARDGIITGMTQSIAVAFLATFFGLLFSLPLGLLAARNVTANKVVYWFARIQLIFLRGTPELILAVIFIVAMKLENAMTAGVCALVIGTTGFFAKLIADAAEEVDPMPREAVFTTGATRLQESTTSVIPQAMPSIIGNLLYVLDINLRTSAILGLVGAGGIGTLLFNSLRVLQLQTTGAIILTIFVIVYAVEVLAGWVRKQIL